MNKCGIVSFNTRLKNKVRKIFGEGSLNNEYYQTVEIVYVNYVNRSRKRVA